ncbi:hypothetical protein BC827DRAFT_1158701 [Russula dissimulans]|nr:hypothetical protein BC827DRAFT_1158701 [Russula dissimulans]
MRACARESGCRGIDAIRFSRLAGPGASEHPESAGGSNCSVIGDTGSEANSSHHSTRPSHGLDIIEIKNTGSEASGSGHSSYSSTSLTSHIKETISTYFDTDEDFTLALLLDKANMKDTLANKFIDLFHHCITGGGRFTISSVADIEAAWAQARADTTSMDNISSVDLWTSDSEHPQTDLSYDILSAIAPRTFHTIAAAASCSSFVFPISSPSQR